MWSMTVALWHRPQEESYPRSKAIAASAIISSFALAVRGKASVGEKVVAFVKARNR